MIISKKNHKSTFEKEVYLVDTHNDSFEGDYALIHQCLNVVPHLTMRELRLPKSQ